MNSGNNEMQQGQNSEAEQVSFLMSALTEAQASVRAFDTKAQIVGIGYIFAVGIISTIGSMNPDKPEFSILTIIFAWLLVIIPIVLFGAVLYPSRKMAPVLGERSNQVKRLYHVSTDYHKDVDSYLKEIDDCDIKVEISYELMKVSALRDLKRIRFIRSLYMTCFSFSLLFLSQVVRSSGSGFFG